MKYIFLSLLLFVNSSIAEELRFPDNGFKISSLESLKKDVFFQPLMMNLTPKNGLGKGVVVQIQPSVVKNIEEYKVISEAEFEKYKMIAISSEIKGSSYIYECIQTLSNGVKLHSYGRAMMKGNLVYSALATTPVDEWEENSKKLKETVNSFELI